MDVNERRARVTEEATHWWTRLGTKAPAEVSEVDRQEFTQWLRESPLHVAELLHVAHVHDVLERFKLWNEFPLETQHEDDTIIALPSSLGSEGKAVGGGRINSNRRVRFLLAASVAALAILAGWLAVRTNATTVKTVRAERREVMLTDGTIVNLEPETTLRVNLGKHQRSIALTQGRALFHVAKDSARPFIVHAGSTSVRALGTIFGVEQKKQNIIVTVSEGKVAIAPPAGLLSASSSSNLPLTALSERQLPTQRQDETNGTDYPSVGSGKGSNSMASPTSNILSANVEREAQRVGRNAMASGEAGELFLVANQQVTIQKSGAAGPVEKVDSSRALAWSEGLLVFDSTSLSEVAEEFNHYNQVQLRIRGDTLGHRTISGVFKASDPQTIIDFISAGVHVVVTHQGSGEIVISPGS